MMFFPFMIPIQVTPAGLADRVQQLEKAVVVLLESLQSIVENLERKLGPGCVGEDAGRLVGAASDAGVQTVVENLDRELKDGSSPTAVRRLREELGCTWDQAHEAVGQWQNLPREQKLRCIRLARLMKSLESPSQK